LEARLRDVLRHEAGTLPFTLTVADVHAVRRARRSPTARLRVPAAVLASAAAVVIVLGGLVAWRTATMPPTGAPPPNPLAADLASYEELANGIAIIDGEVIGRGEELEGAPDRSEVVIGTIGANSYIDVVIDCRGGQVEAGVRMGDIIGAQMATQCDARATTFTMPGFETDGAVVWMKADPGTVWRLVVGGTYTGGPPATAFELASYEDLEEHLASDSAMPVIARGEHPVAETGVEPIRTDLGPVGDIGIAHFAYSCSGGSIQLSRVLDGQVLASSEAACSDRPGLYGDGTGPVDPRARFVVTAAPDVVWRVVVSGTSMPEEEPTPPPPPALGFETSPAAAYEGALDPGQPVSLEMPTLADGSTIVVAFGCAGDPAAVIQVTVDGEVEPMRCLASGIRRFVPAGVGPTTVELASTRRVRLAVAVSSFTQQQAGAVVVVPSARLAAVDGTSSAPGFTVCVTSFAIPSGQSADEGCGPAEYVVPEGRAVRVRSGDSLELLGGREWALTGATITYVPSAEAGTSTPGEPVRLPDADGPGVGGGFSVRLPPKGDWTLLIEVSGTLGDGTTFSAQQLFRVVVEP
jgi:hypothetical protein